MGLIEIGAGAAALVSILGLLKLAATWFWIVFKRAVEDVLEPLEGKMDQHATYVRHHLGPNGDTPPLWRRVEALEKKVGI